MTNMLRLGRAAALLTLLIRECAALYINGSITAPCDSPLYCQGPVLSAIELAQPFSDSKTFVDMPTKQPLDQVLAAFDKLAQPLSNNTDLNDFLSTYFSPAGGELDEVPEAQLTTDAKFLDSVNDTVIKEFVQKVIDIWPDLTRSYTGASACDGCVSSFIPVNRTFVVAGGRFREYYYWDSFWIVEGLLRTGGSFTEISRNIIENFLDLVEQIGFVPNGGRVYYLNRSQPPMLTQMVRTYIEQTNDTTILDRAVPLLIKEHDFWMTNRSVSVTAASGETFKLNQYHVQNNQPRPESFREDYITANNHSYYSTSGIIYPETQALNDSQKAALYANLASGAETGWDYSTRWLANPSDAVRDVYFPLRSLNVVNLVSVDLNSILYWNEITIAGFLSAAHNDSGAQAWTDLAETRSQAMYALMWNETLWSYFDYNISSKAHNIYVPDDSTSSGSCSLTTSTSSTTSTVDKPPGTPAGKQVLFDVAQLYPFWTGAAPCQLKDNPLAVKQAYSRVAAYLAENKGGIPATNLQSGQQWDQPNVWPPLQYILTQGLLNTPPTFGLQDPEYIETQAMALELAQRYLDSTFCTWYATGGSTSETPQLMGVTPGATGTMFEKYADNATDAVGSGGEYAVVEGFGWSNGALIWAVDTFGNQLKRPQCGNITGVATSASATRRRRSSSSSSRRSRSAVELDPYDARWVKDFGARRRKRNT